MRFDNASIVVYYCLIQMNIINLGILAHIDAGKTSVTENLLLEKCGRVDNGDTITDSMDIEKRRGITVRASTTSIIWNGVKCNIIDTPGHMDFIAEVERTFKMLDGAVLILSAKEGIQAQTKLLFNTLQKLQIPTIIFINKIDREFGAFVSGYKSKSVSRCPVYAKCCRWIGLSGLLPNIYKGRIQRICMQP